MPPSVKTFSEEELLAGLSKVSATLAETAAQRNITLPVVAAVSGGAIAVLRHHTRASTHDIDFHHPNKQVEDTLTAIGSQVAAALNWGPGSKYWFNAALSGIIGFDPAYNGVYDAAVRMNDSLYTSPQLVLYIIPWEWQLHRKLARMSRDWRMFGDYASLRRVDIEDAVTILHLFVSGQEGQPVKESTIRSWYRQAPDASRLQADVFLVVENTYRETHKRAGLIIGA